MAPAKDLLAPSASPLYLAAASVRTPIVSRPRAWRPAQMLLLKPIFDLLSGQERLALELCLARDLGIFLLQVCYEIEGNGFLMPFVSTYMEALEPALKEVTDKQLTMTHFPHVLLHIATMPVGKQGTARTYVETAAGAAPDYMILTDPAPAETLLQGFFPSGAVGRRRVPRVSHHDPSPAALCAATGCGADGGGGGPQAHFIHHRLQSSHLVLPVRRLQSAARGVPGRTATVRQFSLQENGLTDSKRI